MAKPEDEEEQQHLATLDDLEGTEEEIANYQSLLKDIPEIYERKFNERVKPILERRRELTEEREQLIQQIQHALPAGGERTVQLLQARLSSASESEDDDPPTQTAMKRPLALLAMVATGMGIGLLLSKQVTSTPTTVTPLPTPVDRSEGLSNPIDSPKSERSLPTRIVDQAIAEWDFFGRPLLRDGVPIHRGKNERDDGQWQRIRTYWRDGVLNNSILRQEDISSEDNPWSAAFISFIFRTAGARDQFPYSPTHSLYIKQAIENKIQATPNSSFIGHRISDYAPQPGHLICRTRSWAKNEVTYDNAVTYDFFPSRCELVVRSSPNQIDVIGGDQKDSVMREQVKAVQGKIAPENAKDWLVVIETTFD
ncbi:MAG: DUF2272 domain-containing protein [Cyanobacteriota bacterium]